MEEAWADDVTAGFSSLGRVELVVTYLWLLMGPNKTSLTHIGGEKGLERMMGKLEGCFVFFFFFQYFLDLPSPLAAAKFWIPEVL